MADPILPDHFRTQVVFQGASGMPEDRFVNNWAWHNTDQVGTIDDLTAAVTRVLDAFYTGLDASSRTVMQYMSNRILPGEVEYRTYDLGETPPRTPHITVPNATYVFGSAPPLPEEVATVLSLVLNSTGSTNGIDTVNIPRRSQRGRVYIGPLNTTALGSEANRSVVLQAFRDVLIDRALNVMNTTENVDWAVVSQRWSAAVLVTGGYVDDAFDTQRRRGPKPINRVPFGDYQVSV